MEDFPVVEPLPDDSLAKRVAGVFITGIRFVGHQLAKSNQNPHEGRLRGSVIPDKYLQVPDYPPPHDDTI